MLICLPVSRSELQELAKGGSYLGTGFAATDGFCRAFEVTPTDEQAEYTLSWLAMVSALAKNGLPLVAVVDGEPVSGGDESNETVADDDFGRITTGVAPGDIRCWLTLANLEAKLDIDGGDIKGCGLPDIWEDPAVQKFIATEDLCWYDVSEVSLLSSQIINTGGMKSS